MIKSETASFILCRTTVLHVGWILEEILGMFTSTRYSFLSTSQTSIRHHLFFLEKKKLVSWCRRRDPVCFSEVKLYPKGLQPSGAQDVFAKGNRIMNNGYKTYVANNKWPLNL